MALFFGLKNAFIYLCKNKKYSYFENFKTNFKGEIQCQIQESNYLIHP
jgi:hypothetical protein